MTGIGYVKNSDHVIAHRQNAVLTENMRRHVIRRELEGHAARAHIRHLAIAGVVFGAAIAILFSI